MVVVVVVVDGIVVIATAVVVFLLLERQLGRQLIGKVHCSTTPSSSQSVVAAAFDRVLRRW